MRCVIADQCMPVPMQKWCYELRTAFSWLLVGARRYRSGRPFSWTSRQAAGQLFYMQMKRRCKTCSRAHSRLALQIAADYSNEQKNAGKAKQRSAQGAVPGRKRARACHGYPRCSFWPALLIPPTVYRPECLKPCSVWCVTIWWIKISSYAWPGSSEKACARLMERIAVP